MVWLAAIAGGGAAESTPGAATPDADAGRDASSSLRPVRLRCEYLANPLGIAVREPRLSWALESEQNGQFQTAYRILAASSEQRLAAGHGDLWDSGVVSSAETLCVPYAGSKLASRQRCYWRVQVWDKDGTPAGTSEIAWFEMGLLEPGDWQARWITGGRSDASPRLRRACVPDCSEARLMEPPGAFQERGGFSGAADHDVRGRCQRGRPRSLAGGRRGGRRGT